MARRRQMTKRQRQMITTLLTSTTVFVVIVITTCLVRNLAHQNSPIIQQPIQVKTIQRQHQEFIQSLAPTAVKYGKIYGILPSITLAQAILESDWGQSQLASRYHNLFGVKSDDPNNSQVLKTQEYVDGKWESIAASFKVYTSFDESIQDHAALLVNGTTWNKQQYYQVVTATNYLDAAAALQEDGYATDPTYTQKIIKIIEKYHLNQYDTQ